MISRTFFQTFSSISLYLPQNVSPSWQNQEKSHFLSNGKNEGPKLNRINANSSFLFVHLFIGQQGRMSKTKNHYWWNNLLYRIKIYLHLQASEHRNLVSSTLSWNLENHFQMDQNRTPEFLQTFLLSVKADLIDLFLNCSAFFLTIEFLIPKL